MILHLWEPPHSFFFFYGHHSLSPWSSRGTQRPWGSLDQKTWSRAQRFCWRGLVDLSILELFQKCNWCDWVEELVWARGFCEQMDQCHTVPTSQCETQAWFTSVQKYGYGSRPPHQPLVLTAELVKAGCLPPINPWFHRTHPLSPCLLHPIFLCKPCPHFGCLKAHVWWSNHNFRSFNSHIWWLHAHVWCLNHLKSC